MNQTPVTDSDSRWKPLAASETSRIAALFAELYPAEGYGDLSGKISSYWLDMLHRVWKKKPDRIRKKDMAYDPGDPLSRIRQKTVVIAYADSVSASGEKTLATLDRFLARYFPAAGGLHLLPACTIVEDRFNDGGFSQVTRDTIHPRFGTNWNFAELMEKYYSMADFVLNHVDIEHPAFQAFMNGDDHAADCFYVFSEAEYQRRLAAGDFDLIFRPRPFPLFTIFRRRPTDAGYARMDIHEKISAMNALLSPDDLPEPVVGMLFVFDKIKNDQMLLDEDYRYVVRFKTWFAERTDQSPEAILTVSTTQETRHTPWIFINTIQTRADLLAALGYDTETAIRCARRYEEHDPVVFGEPVRAMTTFSHVQVDLNTATFAGLKLLADDFSWYLGMDLDMLRLDAANFAFKKWKTTCFGLPEVQKLMQILYLSMACVSPRMVANLEVNNTLDAILSQMTCPGDPPPMMYDFHLACLLPTVFNTVNARILDRIPELIQRYDPPKTSIRFSVAESHDGKSVRGSLDLLTAEEGMALAETVTTNNGKIKCRKGAECLEPYELCVSTWDALLRLHDPNLEADRFLAFYTLAFALMGRNVKSIYFNDLVGLPNDIEKMTETGEFRDIKRTRSDYAALCGLMGDPDTVFHRIGRGINHLIALTDADPALAPRGDEAGVLESDNPAVAVICNHCAGNHTWVIVNLSPQQQSLTADLTPPGTPPADALFDQITGRKIALLKGKCITEIKPFERLWLKIEGAAIRLTGLDKI